ncbi:MAG: hypothetical protein Q8R24_00820 [Legionellaceae bacterium]|nr:hypothetical protein [Legionellaceae bacterium]
MHDYSILKRLPDKSHQWSALFIILLSIAVNIPYLKRSYFPVHDTLSVFQFFSYYYSELLTHHELPWWLPASAYGMPIDSYMLFSFGPFQYLVLGIGYLFHVQNALLLFSLSLIGDTLFFAFGAYLFCRHILHDRLPTFICVLSILVLVQYDRQIYWNFKLLLPIPLCLYWMQLAIERCNLGYLCLMFATLLSWAFGSIAYVLPVQFYVTICYGLLFILFNLKMHHLRGSSLHQLFKQWVKNITQRENLLLLLAGLGIIGMCVYMMYSIKSVMMTDMAYNAIGRDANLGVGLDYYLNYGGNTGPEKITEFLNGLPTSHPHDFLAYIGLINVIFVLNSIFSKRKSPSQVALTLTALLVIIFTVTATGVAQIAYVLPGMNMVRHIGYFITIAKLLLIMLAGFGLQAYLHED